MKKPLRYDDAVGAFVLCGGGCNKKHRTKTERFQNCYLIRLLQLSAAGEVFLEGTCPLSRCPQTAKFPAPCFWRTGKVGEKSDSFSRAERTRPLRPVSHLLCSDFGNVPVERFQRDFRCRNLRTRHAVSLQMYSKNTSPAALSWSSLTGSTAPVLFVPARWFLLCS